MKKFLFLLFLFISVCSTGQERIASWESQVALNYAVKEWRLSTSISHRSTQFRTEDVKSNKFAFLELNQFLGRRIGAKSRVSFGYKYRSLGPLDDINSIEQRLTQQFTIAHHDYKIRLMSRIRLEQRFQNTADFRHRYRYRFSLDMPLNGVKLDEKEFYLMASNEVLLELENRDSSFDNRISSGLGYVLNTFCKVQLEMTYRMESLEGQAEYVPFLNTSIVLNLQQ